MVAAREPWSEGARPAAGSRPRRPARGRGGAAATARRAKLYSIDSIVDRGFEDIEEEGETRRVHWTIVKRTTADQISRKPVATVYVLQRDGRRHRVSDTSAPPATPSTRPSSTPKS